MCFNGLVLEIQNAFWESLAVHAVHLVLQERKGFLQPIRSQEICQENWVILGRVFALPQQGFHSTFAQGVVSSGPCMYDWCVLWIVDLVREAVCLPTSYSLAERTLTLFRVLWLSFVQQSLKNFHILA